MSAINIVCQPRHRCVHVVTDAASYDLDGVITGLSAKVFTVPHWPGVVATQGPALALSRLGEPLARTFASLDDAVARIEAELPDLVQMFGGDPTEDETVGIVLAGWSTERDAPESYVIYTDNKPPPGETQEAVDANAAFGEPFKLQKLPDVIGAPVVTDTDLILASQFEGVDVDADPQLVVWTLAKHLEMQRRTKFPTGHYCVGGWGQYTLVRPDGIAQYLMQRWPEDRYGELIQPARMDWQRLNQSRPLHVVR